MQQARKGSFALVLLLQLNPIVEQIKKREVIYMNHQIQHFALLKEVNRSLKRWCYLVIYFPPPAIFVTYLTRIVIRRLDFRKLFSTQNSYLKEQNPKFENNHSTHLPKLVITRYLSVRCKSYSNVHNQKSAQETSQQNYLLKVIHNLHL